eukprot:TRINITY_DN5828_c0_g1_i3.p1 TRINITY_DN5828_c0_g1~~TRINITY_DN5828_c0_g1_i3.p1  ORF type:complete len:292 (+),score=29.25 TRINITY_DN5828_c0_g1_i3:903-1778(+)
MWASKERYASQLEILQVVRNYSAHSIHPGVLVIDWKHYQCVGDWGFTLNPNTCWPDPLGMVASLGRLGVQSVFVSVHPWSQNGSASYGNLSSRGLCLRDVDGTAMNWGGWTLSTCREGGGANAVTCLYDPFNPAAREYLWGSLKTGYYDRGITDFWLDGTEPVIQKQFAIDRAVVSWKGQPIPAESAFLLWPTMHAQTVYEGAQQAEGVTATPPKSWILSRSAWAGSHLKNVVVWSGDIQSTWDSLAISVRSALNFQLVYPYWNTETGGSWGGYWHVEGGSLAYSIYSSVQ